MNEKAVNRLKAKFITVAMSTLIASMLFIVGTLYFSVRWFNSQSIKSSLDFIISHNGELDKYEFSGEESEDSDDLFGDAFNVDKEPTSPEFKYSTRYFVIYFDENHEITAAAMSHISAVSEEQAKEYGLKALSHKRKTGHIGAYFYKMKYNDDDSGLIVYLDGSGFITTNLRMFYLSLMVITLGAIVAVFFARYFAEWALRSEIRSREIQNQFMTNISHELKTPLSVILANTEMQEIISGENDWTESTKRQVERMNGLIQNLVTIARAEESSASKGSDKVAVTEIVKETAKTFESLALSTNKALTTDIDEEIAIHGDEAQIRQLCYLLLDNAIKYCDDQGRIEVSLKTKGSTVLFSVANTYVEGKDTDYSKFFERFYRKDESHCIDKGGFGIGLSVAESIVRSHHGEISASWSDDMIKFECQLKLLIKPKNNDWIK